MNFNQLDLSLIKLNILISELHTNFLGFSLAALSIVILEICFGMLAASGILFVLNANVDTSAKMLSTANVETER